MNIESDVPSPATRIRFPRLLALTWLAWAALTSHCLAEGVTERRGSLVIIGGGERPGRIHHRFIALAGGTNHARIAVLPMASGEPERSGRLQAEEFRAFGVKDVDVVRFDRSQAMLPATAERLMGYTGVFFTGGDQARLAAVLVGTPCETALHRMRDTRGAVIGGTSAGAAIMSRVMITGDQRGEPDRKADFAVVRRGATLISTGLGLVTNAIVDQHFIARRRQNRLVGVTLEHPELVGVGIDEATALVVLPDGSWEVEGEGSVMVFDARGVKVREEGPHANLGAIGVRFHLLLPGDRWDPTAGR
jgi:cyanophycinase